MSGYLARLVDRGAGAPGGSVVPRPGPVFPLGPPVAAGEEADVGPGLLSSSVPKSPPPSAPAPLPSVAAAAATSMPTPVGLAPALAGQERRPTGAGGSTRVRGRAPAAAATPMPAASQAAVAASDLTIRAPEPSTPQPAVPRPSPAESSAPAPSEIVAQAAAPAEQPTVTLVPRQDTTRDPLPPRGNRETRASRQPTPRIEVRIGRVEVRRPPEPEPAQWSTSVPQPTASAAEFDRLAAARRYVDRRWS